MYFGLGIVFWSVQRNGITFARAAFIATASAVAYLEIAHIHLTDVKTGSVWLPYILWILFIVLIALAIRWQSTFNVLTKPLHVTFAILGLATYPLYLVHKTLGGLVNRTLYDGGIGAEIALMAAISISLAIAITVATVAEPVTRRILRIIVGRLRPLSPQH